MAPAMSINVQQDSRLLRLPAELRLRIYEIVIDNTNLANIDTSSGVPRLNAPSHNLNNVCRQMTDEFAPFFTKYAPSKCPLLIHRSKNFELPAKRDVVDFFRSLPPLPGRTYIQTVLVDDGWKQEFAYNITKLLTGFIHLRGHSILALVDVHFDHKAFDPTPLLRSLKKEKSAFGLHGNAVKDAFASAVKRYAGEDVETKERKFRS